MLAQATGWVSGVNTRSAPRSAVTATPTRIRSPSLLIGMTRYARARCWLMVANISG